jgi:acetyl-CoA acetyltransferase
MNMLGHAVRAVESAAASVILIVGGDATGLGGYAKVAANFNMVTQLHLAPLGHGGPNGVYALVTSRQMKKFGLEKSDYGHVAIAQRTWAAGNPFAVYRTPMTMQDYLAAPMVADPLSRYDCVPVVAGAQAVVVAHPDRCPRGCKPVRVRAHRASFNYDNQEGDGLQTGIGTFAGELWQEAGVRPEDIDVASIYDDYPTMVLTQLNDLGMIPDNDLRRFARREIGERRFPINTWGGMLSAGQPGGPAGGLNGISEAVLQLQHRAGERQVKDARLAVATGYGMTMYRYGGTAAAAILERQE